MEGETMDAAARRWIAAWLLLEALLPGAALFGLLLWLSQRFVREGFGDVRHYAFAHGAFNWSATAPVQRNWWSCTCDSIAQCACLPAIARGLRRCCVKSLRTFL
jgi:hypothetical protein